MTVDSPLWRALRRISTADIPSADREVLRPALNALEEGRVMHLPTYVIARIRDLDARLPKKQ